MRKSRDRRTWRAVTDILNVRYLAAVRAATEAGERHCESLLTKERAHSELEGSITGWQNSVIGQIVPEETSSWFLRIMEARESLEAAGMEAGQRERDLNAANRSAAEADFLRANADTALIRARRACQTAEEENRLAELADRTAAKGNGQWR